ncbi:hypothetical protein PMI06_009049 [Burkholderia sp. BT03]|nr:hypothetical protein PMI06_009049 [Burkholderia sp. BT03]SKC56364.1 hypothetical protein SAMN06266956_0814 [Paraburkholderia hospita]
MSRTTQVPGISARRDSALKMTEPDRIQTYDHAWPQRYFGISTLSTTMMTPLLWTTS